MFSNFETIQNCFNHLEEISTFKEIFSKDSTKKIWQRCAPVSGKEFYLFMFVRDGFKIGEENSEKKMAEQKEKLLHAGTYAGSLNQYNLADVKLI